MMVSVMLAALVTLASAHAAPAPAAPPVVNFVPGKPTVIADTVIADKLKAIDEKLAKKDYMGAIQLTVSSFNINASACRAIMANPITFKDESGNEIVAHTRLDQVIVVDPRQVAFKSARFLATILAHEVTHCEQNQKMYSLALNTDKALEPLKDKLPLLRDAAEVDDLASAAEKDSPTKAEAVAKFKERADKLAMKLTPEQFTALSRQVVEAVQAYKRTLAELQEMEASLRAFELPGVIPPPKADQKPSEEFVFQYRFLLAATNKLMRTRALFGAQGDAVCRMVNFVPFEMTLQEERNCVESLRLIQAYFAKVSTS